MSRIILCSLSIYLIFGSTLAQVDGQLNYPARSMNSTPIWQQMGTINPYHRPQSQPIWHTYSNIPRANFCRSSLVPFHPIVNMPMNSFSIVEPIVNTWTADSVDQPLESTFVAPTIDSNFDNVGENLLIDSINPTESLEGQVVEGVVANDVSPDLATQNSASDDLEINNDESDSNSSLETDDSTQLDGDNDHSDEDLQLEIEELKETLEAAKNRNLQLSKQMEHMRKVAERQLIQAIKEGENKNKTRQFVKETESRAKKEAAWEIAKLRKEADSAKRELAATKKRAEQKQQELLTRLEAVESKLKNASKAHQHESDHNGPSAESNTTKNMTLAEMAAMKRKKRAEMEAKQQQKKKAAKPRQGETAKTDDDMNRQIDRAVGKIKRRFTTKIARVKEQGGSQDEIEKLESEMNIQVEKMQERIRNRFKKRTTNSGK